MAKKPSAAAPQAAEGQEAPAKSKAPAFVFIGDKDGHGPDEISLMGYTFAKKGKPVTVDNKAAAAKFANNSHFKAA